MSTAQWHEKAGTNDRGTDQVAILGRFNKYELLSRDLRWVWAIRELVAQVAHGRARANFELRCGMAARRL
ncbi:MAG: hypothetical protein ABJC26_17195 [Gemmatimonadaceae bacterium]